MGALLVVGSAGLPGGLHMGETSKREVLSLSSTVVHNVGGAAAPADQQGIMLREGAAKP